MAGLEQEEKGAPRRGKNRSGKKKGGLGLVAVQSAACVCVIVLVLVIQLISGSLFGQLRDYFQDAMTDNTLGSALSGLLNNKPSMTTTPDLAVTATTGGTTVISDTTVTAATETQTTAPPATEATTVTAAATTSAATKTASATTGAASATTAAEGGGAVQAVAPAIPSNVSMSALNIKKGSLPLPYGTITSGFGFREDPINGGTEFHLGLDIAAAAGVSISAMYPGTVSEVGVSASYGNYIKIDHANGVQVMYAHCSAVTAKKGDAVKAGTVVAKVGSTGHSTGNHVHIELHKNGIIYNPVYAVPVDQYS